MILKRHKNELYETIQSSGFDIAEFRHSEVPALYTLADDAKKPGIDGARFFSLEYRDSGLRFEVQAEPRIHGSYVSGYTTFPLRDSSFSPTWGDFPAVISRIITWLRDHVAGYIEELSTPDSWARLAESRDLLGESIGGLDEPEQDYSEAEKLDVKRAVERFRTSIVETFQPSDDQMSVVSERLDYLIGAVDRLNKRDWRGLAISTVIGIATTLSLDTEQGRVLFGLLQQAFKAVQHLVGG